jgi:hypothetical protein
VAALSVLAMAADRQTLLDQQDNAWWGREMIDKSLFFAPWSSFRLRISHDVDFDFEFHVMYD